MSIQNSSLRFNEYDLDPDLEDVRQIYPLGYDKMYEEYMAEFRRRNVIDPEQYFPKETNPGRQVNQLVDMELNMEMIDDFEIEVAKEPHKYPNPYTPNDLLEMSNDFNSTIKEN